MGDSLSDYPLPCARVFTLPLRINCRYRSWLRSRILWPFRARRDIRCDSSSSHSNDFIYQLSQRHFTLAVFHLRLLHFCPPGNFPFTYRAVYHCDCLLPFRTFLDHPPYQRQLYCFNGTVSIFPHQSRTRQQVRIANFQCHNPVRSRTQHS
jgi:hypothetical protein